MPPLEALAIYCREQHNEKVSTKESGNSVLKYRTKPGSPGTERTAKIKKTTKFQNVMQEPNRKLLGRYGTFGKNR